jgi:hypothetical protein
MSIMASDAGAFKAATGLFASLGGEWYEVPLGGGEPPTSPPFTIFGAAAPTVGYASDGTYALGVRFSCTAPTTLRAIRFFKDARQTGTHVGRLFLNSTGALLAEVTFTNETESGWQEQALSAPVALEVGVEYVIGIDFPIAGRVFTTNYAWPKTTDSVVATHGPYRAGPTAQMPSTLAVNYNYWIDGVFTT